jgi:hypothetical protein
MIELLIVGVIVGWAAWYSWTKLSKTASGKKACCEDGEGCAFKGFIDKEGNAGRLNCSEQDREKRLAEKRAED